MGHRTSLQWANSNIDMFRIGFENVRGDMLHLHTSHDVIAPAHHDDNCALALLSCSY